MQKISVRNFSVFTKDLGRQRIAPTRLVESSVIGQSLHAYRAHPRDGLVNGGRVRHGAGTFKFFPWPDVGFRGAAVAGHDTGRPKPGGIGGIAHGSVVGHSQRKSGP